MPNRTVLVCDDCHRDALRVTLYDGRELCPRCLLSAVDDDNRTGELVELTPRRREQPVARVARMRGRG